MALVLKGGVHFNYLEQSPRQKNLPDYTLPSLHFRLYISELSGSSGQYIPAWQLHEGALKPRDLRTLLDSLPGPLLLGIEDAGWDSLETRAGSSQSAGSKILCLWYGGFIFSFDAVMEYGWRENSLQFSRLQIYGAVGKYLPCVWDYWEGKRNIVFSEFMKTITLICFAWGLSLF